MRDDGSVHHLKIRGYLGDIIISAKYLITSEAESMKNNGGEVATFFFVSCSFNPQTLSIL